LADRRVRSTNAAPRGRRAEVRNLVDSQDAQISTQTEATAAS